MAIVCGVDFSEPSLRAATAAAHLARRARLPLCLVHALEIPRDDDFAVPWQTFRDAARVQLRRVAESLAGVTDSIEVHVEMGAPDQVLLEAGTALAAKLIVIGATGRRPGATGLGVHAHRVAHRSHVPVIVVREGSAFQRWALESKPLRVVVGVDASMSAEHALRWIADLQSLSPCEVLAVQLYWPPEQFQRLGLGGARSYLDPDPQVTATLEREFADRASRLPGLGAVRYRSEPHLGRIAERLVAVAAEERADLVVVGSRHRKLLERLWEGSVSRALLRDAKSSVACVPAPVSTPASSIPVLRSVLVATDFSPVGDAALPLAYATVAQGGTVHLVHVVKGSTDPVTPHDIFPRDAVRSGTPASESARSALEARIPLEAVSRGTTTQVHVLESNDPARAIRQAAERLGVDVVCIGSCGSSVGMKALLGSVARDVLAESRVPVLLTRPELA